MYNDRDILGPAVVVIVLATFVVSAAAYLMEKSSATYKQLTTISQTGTTMHTKAILSTSMGEIELELLEKDAPKTVENFTKLASQQFFEGTKFHRVIANFMIQGGDPNTKGDNVATYGSGGPGYTFKDEPNSVKLERGVVAMANSGPNTNGSQFFIITAAETPWLQGKHTAFARVTKGMDIVDQISKVATGPRDLPLQPIIIQKVTVGN